MAGLAKERLDVGLFAESVNTAWNKDWQGIREREKNTVMPEHEKDGRQINRVDLYLDFFESQGIDPGVSGRHARALVWFISGDMLQKIDGFPMGRNYGECIAAEIGVSKKIESLGYQVEQFSKYAFSFIRHFEWNQDFAGGEYTKHPVLLRKLERLSQLERMHLKTGLVARSNAILSFYLFVVKKWRERRHSAKS